MPTSSMYAMLNGHRQIGVKPNISIGILDDAWFKYVGDIGLGGPDKGKGGKYLVVGHVYDGEIPEEYYILRINPYRQWLLMRAVGKPGEPLGETYTVTLPGPIPTKDFWSFMAYDNHTRSILETDRRSGGIDSMREGMKVEIDDSATSYFGPKAPKGQEKNRVQTVPGKSYNVVLRLYGPLQAWFDRGWKLGDFTPLQH